MLVIGIFLLTAVFAGPGNALAQKAIPLWPEDELPNSKGLALEDSISNKRIYQIKFPRMYPFIPPSEENTGAAVLIFSGWRLSSFDV